VTPPQLSATRLHTATGRRGKNFKFAQDCTQRNFTCSTPCAMDLLRNKLYNKSSTNRQQIERLDAFRIYIHFSPRQRNTITRDLHVTTFQGLYKTIVTVVGMAKFRLSVIPKQLNEFLLHIKMCNYVAVGGVSIYANPCGTATTWVVSANTLLVKFRFLGLYFMFGKFGSHRDRAMNRFSRAIRHIIRYDTHTVHRCGLLLQMSQVAWSVCLSVGHTTLLCKNG